MDVTRLLAILIGGLAVGGLGAIYVWSSLNALLAGELTWARGASALAVTAGLVALLLVLVRYVRHLEQPRH
ncbi:MAG: hypothetical protein QJR03_14620 [Sphaerobacter sp.]|nr:hypothetical protein [Sphaerobacter sp.]